MEEIRKSRWEGNEHWFMFDHQAGLRRFKNTSSLGSTTTTIALRALKYQLEKEMGFEISDDLFLDIFRKVSDFHPIPALGAYASLEFIQPLQRILERHGVAKDYLSAIYRVFRIRVANPRCYKSILLHVPHSSTLFPKESKYSFNDLDKDERLLIDYYTDELFIPEYNPNQIATVVFPYCRLYCDVERLVNDPLEKEGLGIRYIGKVQSGIRSWNYRSFNNAEDAFKQHVDYHALVSKKLIDMGDSTLIIDCHSFSALPNLLNTNPPDIDICIGYNDDETRPDKVAIGNIVQHFMSKGYKVGINEPFSNSKTFSVPMNYYSIMIEINKRLYMDELTLEKTDRFVSLKQDIQSLYSVLIKN